MPLPCGCLPDDRRHGITKGHILINTGKGTCYSNQLLSMYGVSLKGEPPRIRAPPGFRHLCSDAVDAEPTIEPAVTATCEFVDELGDEDAGELSCVPGEGFVEFEEDEACEAVVDVRATA